MAGFCCCLPHSRGANLQQSSDPTEETVESSLDPPCSRHLVYSSSKTEPKSVRELHIANEHSWTGTPIALGVPTELDQLVVDDSESEDNQTRLARKASAVLEAMRSKLIRQLPSERDIAQRSGVFAGNSENEIARRAELRRLRQQRIQDELNRMDTQEDQSIASSYKNTPCFSSLTSLTHHGGPRDTIEFLVLDRNISSPVGHSTKASLKSSDTFNGKKVASQKSPSCDSLALSVSIQHAHDTNKTNQIEKQHDKAKGKLPYLSNSPNLQADVASRCPQISSQVEQSSDDDQSALNIWLMAQQLPLTDNTSVNSSSPDRDKSFVPEHSLAPQETQKDSSILGDLPADSSVLFEQISDDRASRASSKMSTISEISLRNTQNAINARLDEQRHINVHIPALAKSNSQDLAESYAAALAFSSQLDNGSSNYNSVRPSFQPSPVRSRPNLHSLDPQDLVSVTWAPFQGYEAAYDSTGSVDLGRSSSYATAEADFNSEAAGRNSPMSRQLSRNTAEFSSTGDSETPGFQVRETELATVDDRFREALSRSKSAQNFESRFKEHISDADSAGVDHGSELYDVSSKKIEENLLKSHGTSSHLGFISVRVSPFRLIGGERRSGKNDPDLRGEVKIAGDPKRGPTTAIMRTEALVNTTQQGGASTDGVHLCRTKTGLRGKRKRTKRLRSRNTHNLKPSQHKISTKDRILPRPSIPYEAPQSTLSRTGDPASITERKLGIPPRSWAKYPSHTRHERNRLDKKEEIALHDFAPAFPGRGQKSCKTQDIALDTFSVKSSSVSGAIGKAMKNGLCRIFSFRESFAKDQELPIPCLRNGCASLDPASLANVSKNSTKQATTGGSSQYVESVSPDSEGNARGDTHGIEKQTSRDPISVHSNVAKSPESSSILADSAHQRNKTHKVAQCLTRFPTKAEEREPCISTDLMTAKSESLLHSSRRVADINIAEWPRSSTWAGPWDSTTWLGHLNIKGVDGSHRQSQLWCRQPSFKVT